MLEVQRLFCACILESNDPIQPKSIRPNLFLLVPSVIILKGLKKNYQNCVICLQTFTKINTMLIPLVLVDLKNVPNNIFQCILVQVHAWQFLFCK